MTGERWLLISFIILSVIVLIKFVPKKKRRDACILFLFLQTITWILGLIAVQKDLIEYPVQLFPNENGTNRTSFSFEFFIFPVVAILFSLYYPTKANKIIQFLYYFIITGFFTILEVLIEKYTNLANYHHWKWYWTLISVMIVLFANDRYYRWFKKELVPVTKS
jgi:amino acid permease